MQTIPLYSSSANYQEWEHATEDGWCYTIIQDDDDWTLLQRDGENWQEIGGEQAIVEFLWQYALVLAD